ncbi:MAG: carbohydrate porin [Myxococcales bacterium]|nr:carbohydrate porin [Myxococcales bacterium]
MELRRFWGLGLSATLAVIATSPHVLAQPAEPAEPVEGAGGAPAPAEVELDEAPAPPPEPEVTAAPEAPPTTAPQPRGNGGPPSPPNEGARKQPLRLEYPRGSFSFGSYGRVIAAGDLRGGRGRDADIVAHGARIDEGSYGELELTRDDEWEDGIHSRVVSTLAIGEPIFHDSGSFDATIALRNFYVEERGVLDPGLSAWVGSRMYRGDDIYLLDFWPLDNLNTVGGGLKFSFNEDRSFVAWHVGMNLVDDPFQQQSVLRPAAQNQPGTDRIPLLDRPRTISSLKLSHIFPMAGKAGLKAVLYGEVHNLPSGERELDDGRREDLPGDSGAVVGGQVGGFSGEDGTFANLFVRYATGLAAYGEFSTPEGTSESSDVSGAHELLIGLSGNWDSRWASVLVGGYFRSFRDASPEKFRFDNVDEGIFVVRPQVYFTDHLGLALEGSYQAQQRGVLSTVDNQPLMASLWRFGVMPFISPAGRGSFKRPRLRLIYVLTGRDAGARSLYPNTDPFARRQTEQFFGVGAEWWFNSSSYGQ